MRHLDFSEGEVSTLRRGVVAAVVAHALALLVVLLSWNHWRWTGREGMDRVAEATAFPIEMLAADSPKNLSRETAKSLVQTHRGEEVKEAEKEAFLSDRNRKVTQQQSAKVPQLSHERVAQMHQGGSEAESKAPEAKQPISKFGMDWTKALAEASRRDHQRGKAAPGVPFQDPLGGMQPREYVPGMPQGAEAALNTREYMFFTYFQRIRESLDQAWRPILRERIAWIYKKGRKLAADTEYVTRTLVTLNRDGEIVRVQVLDDSGAQELDAAALGALNSAGPFPNPPAGLLQGKTEIEIRWDFLLKT